MDDRPHVPVLKQQTAVRRGFRGADPLAGVTGLAEFYGLVANGSRLFFGWGIFGGILLIVGTFLNLTGRVGTTGSPHASMISKRVS